MDAPRARRQKASALGMRPGPSEIPRFSRLWREAVVQADAHDVLTRINIAFGSLTLAIFKEPLVAKLHVEVLKLGCKWPKENPFKARAGRPARQGAGFAPINDRRKSYVSIELADLNAGPGTTTRYVQQALVFGERHPGTGAGRCDPLLLGFG